MTESSAIGTYYIVHCMAPCSMFALLGVDVNVYMWHGTLCMTYIVGSLGDGPDFGISNLRGVTGFCVGLHHSLMFDSIQRAESMLLSPLTLCNLCIGERIRSLLRMNYRHALAL